MAWYSLEHLQVKYYGKCVPNYDELNCRPQMSCVLSNYKENTLYGIVLPMQNVNNAVFIGGVLGLNAHFMTYCK